MWVGESFEGITGIGAKHRKGRFVDFIGVLGGVGM
jgi:hypothetical protein